MNFDQFVEGYVTCALWSSNDEDGDSFNETGFDSGDIASASIASMHEDCRDFLDDNIVDLLASGMTASSAGNDFWLTRNGHGTGFWDRGLGAVGERLTAAAKVYGGQDMYVGDDGKLYI